MNIETTVNADTLTLSVGAHAVTVTPVDDVEACRLAIDLLMEKLAGVSKHDLMMAAYCAALKGADA